MWFLIQHLCVCVLVWSRADLQGASQAFCARSASSLICVIPTARAIPVSAVGVPYLFVSSMQSQSSSLCSLKLTAKLSLVNEELVLDWSREFVLSNFRTGTSAAGREENEGLDLGCLNWWLLGWQAAYGSCETIIPRSVQKPHRCGP